MQYQKFLNTKITLKIVSTFNEKNDTFRIRLRAGVKRICNFYSFLKLYPKIYTDATSFE